MIPEAPQWSGWKQGGTDLREITRVDIKLHPSPMRLWDLCPVILHDLQGLRHVKALGNVPCFASRDANDVCELAGSVGVDGGERVPARDEEELKV